jgi:hypothetical protein
MHAVLCCAVLCWACRWGYIDIKDLEDVVANYSKADLPLEGLWVDIEAMNNRFQVFTFDNGEGGGRCCAVLHQRLWKQWHCDTSAPL